MRTLQAGFPILSIVLLAAVCGCGRDTGAAGVVRSSALGTYPKESVALLVLEVRKVRGLRPDSPWLKDMASLAEREEGPFRDVLQRLGPGVLARLDRLSLAVVPQDGAAVGYGILAEGSFDGVQVREALGGADLLTLVETETADYSVALLPGGGLAIGPRRILETMRANGAARGHGLDGNPAVLEPLRRVRPEAQIWGALDCRNLQRLFQEGASPSDLSGLPIGTAPVQSLVSIAFRGTIGDTVDIDLLGQADAEAGARTLADAARGLIALGRLGASRDGSKEWLDFLDGLRIDQSGQDVALRASIPEKTMESFVGQVASARRSGRAETAPPQAASPGAAAPQDRAPRDPAAPPEQVAPARTPAPRAGSSALPGDR